MNRRTMPLDLATDPLLSHAPEVDGCKLLDPCMIHKRLGHGGMGVVYRGRHRHLDIDVAVKCLRPELAAAHPSSITRFAQEARLCSRLSHPNLVRVLDMREEGPLRYIVMEFVEGETARERVNRKGPLSVVEAVSIVAAAASGLGYAHENGVVHRDVKPDNILISTKGEVKVSDLGLGKDLGSEAGLTSVGGVLGTPQYMAPEQYEDPGEVGPSTDVYGLGATLFFLLTGQDPIPSGEVVLVMKAVCGDPFPKALARWNTVIPESVTSIVLRATRPAASERHATGGELAQALEAHLTTVRGDDVATAVEGTGRRTVSPPPLDGRGSGTTRGGRVRRSKSLGARIVVGARVLLIVGLSVLGAWLINQIVKRSLTPPRRLLHVETGIVLLLVDPSRSPAGSDDRIPAFYLGETEVTNAQYRRFRPTHSSRSFEKWSLDGDDQPVVSVSARDAEEFCQHYGFRLPDEAEWRLACRAGATTDYPWGDDPDDSRAATWANLHNEANNRILPRSRPGVSWDDGHLVTAPVGRFSPNPFGLHDMIGNVMEWCRDVERIEGVRNRPVCGGSWGNAPRMCRIDSRVLKPETSREQHIGLRVALSRSRWREQGFSAMPEDQGSPGR